MVVLILVFILHTLFFATTDVDIDFGLIHIPGFSIDILFTFIQIKGF